MQPFLQHTTSVSNTHCRGGGGEGEQGILTADDDPFSSVKAYHAETRFYKMKGKEVGNDEDVPVTVPIRHPLVGFTRLMTRWNVGRSIHSTALSYPKKVMPKNQSSCLGNMDRHGRYDDGDGASTSNDKPEEGYSPKLK